MHLCNERGVALSFLSRSGRFLGRLASPVSGNVLLRKRQYTISDCKDTSLGLARYFVIGKLANSRAVLRRFMRDHSKRAQSQSLEAAASSLSHQIEKVAKADSIERLRG